MAESVNLADEFTLPETEAAPESDAPDLGQDFTPPEHAPEEPAKTQDLSSITPKEWWSKPRPALDSLKWMKARFYETAGDVGAATYEQQTEPLMKLPDLSGQFPRERLPGHVLPMDIEAGIYNAVKPVVEGLTSRVGLGTIPLSVAGKVVPIAKAATTTIGAAFTVDMVSHLPEQLKNAWQVLNDPNASRQDKIVAAATPGVTALFAAAGTHGTLHEANALIGQIQERAARPTDVSPETAARENLNTTLADQRVKVQAMGPDGKPMEIELSAAEAADRVKAESEKELDSIYQQAGVDRNPPPAPEPAPAPVAEVAPVEIPPTEPAAPPEVRFTVQQGDPLPEGRTVPPYVQIETTTNQGRGEPLTDAQRGQYPTPEAVLASGLPTGQYTLEQVQAAIKEKAPKLAEEFDSGVGAEQPVQPAGATATKNAQVDVERAARGLEPVVEPAKRELGVAWDEASKALDENPDAAKSLVSELKDKPRAVTDAENALLLHRQIELHNEFNRVKERINDPATDSAVKAEDQARFAVLSDELLDLYNVGKQVGTETARGLNARKTMAAEDFSLANMVTERRAAKGGRELTPEELSHTEALHKKIVETEKAFDDYRSRMSELLQKEEGTPAQRKTAENKFVKALSERANAARERIKARLSSGQVSSGIDPALLKDYAEVGAYHLAKGIVKAAEFADAMAAEFGDAIRPHIEAIRAQAEKIHDSLTNQDPRLKALKSRLAKSTDELKAKTEAGDFSTKERRTPVPLDEEALRLKAENERAKQAYQEALVKDRLSKRTRPQKVQDWIVKWRRGFLLSGPVTLAKLTSAAVQRMVFTPLEEVIGAGYSKLLPSIAERAPREGGLNTTAEARAITDGLTKGMKDAWELLRTGKSSLEVLFGKGRDGAVRESDVMPRSVIDFFGQIHGALKSPVKRAEFARSLEKRMAWNMKQGVDVTDPMVQTRLMVEAYKDGARSIFLQDNVVVDAYNRAITALTETKKATGKQSAAGKIIATTAKVLLPIVRVPTNIVAETIQTATGLVTGSIRLGKIMRTGVEKLKPEEADLVMRELKKGSLGAAAMLLGYLNADKVGGYYQHGQKRRKDDVAFASMKIFGHQVPSFLLHNPLLETIQIGATIRRVAESKLHKKDKEEQGLAGGIWAAALGLIEEVPFVRQQVETAKMLDSREGAYARGNFVKGLAVPALVDATARFTDKDAQGNPIKRNPKTIAEHVKTGIPGLRQTVPIKR